jgi:outer membrane protein OmpA-like peptidoglycan-associated protein
MDKTLSRTITILMMAILIGAFINVNQSVAGEEASDGRFIAYDDGTVWDTQTNLLWAARDNGSNVYWSGAETYCKTYDGGGYKGWRMPTRDELKGLYDRLIFGNNGYHLTKLITLTGGFPWAAEVQGSEAAVVAFNADHETWFWESVTHKSRNRALPVRNGKDGKLVIAEKKQEEVVPPPPPSPETVKPLPPPPLPVQEKISIALNLEFDTAKSVIKKKYHNNIKEVADFMQKYPDTNVVIEGHTDNVDVFKNPENNIKLSQDRADSVRQYLIDKFSIDASRITAVGYGPARPIADNDTKEGRKKNRRVAAVIEKMITK